ncbi:MAG: 5'-3' exonuclease H3TH domain-containing protein [Candidatus Nealsonbacteria bacterium]
MVNKKVLVVFDSNSVIHRAFHALPLLTTKKGEVVGAVYGFLLVFLKAIKEFQPDFVAACFDVKGPTFRHEKYQQYKALRPKAPPELYLQIPMVQDVLKNFSVPVYEKQGFEGDDLIGTISKTASLQEIETIIISGDSDNLQLVNENTKVYALRKGVKDTVLYDEKLVIEKYQGLKPKQLIDYRALRGDATDNIPGVKGVGEKTAIDLLQRFSTLENIYQSLGEIKLKTQDLLLRSKKDAFMSKDLATIIQDVPMDFNLSDCRWSHYDKVKAVRSMESFGFHSLIPRLPDV